jgi:hypothetical protein
MNGLTKKIIRTFLKEKHKNRRGRAYATVCGRFFSFANKVYIIHKIKKNEFINPDYVTASGDSYWVEELNQSSTRYERR